MSILDNRKVYLVGSAMVAYAVTGWYCDYLSQSHAVEIFLEGLGLIFGRHSLAKLSASVASNRIENGEQ